MILRQLRQSSPNQEFQLNIDGICELALSCREKPIGKLQRWVTRQPLNELSMGVQVVH